MFLIIKIHGIIKISSTKEDLKSLRIGDKNTTADALSRPMMRKSKNSHLALSPTKFSKSGVKNGEIHNSTDEYMLM